jgi:hypothetical protein
MCSAQATGSKLEVFTFCGFEEAVVGAGVFMLNWNMWSPVREGGVWGRSDVVSVEGLLRHADVVVLCVGTGLGMVAVG